MLRMEIVEIHRFKSFRWGTLDYVRKWNIFFYKQRLKNFYKKNFIDIGLKVVFLVPMDIVFDTISGDQNTKKIT